MYGSSQAAVGIWNRMLSYRKAQLSPGFGFLSSITLSTPRALRRADRVAALLNNLVISLLISSFIVAYAFPPPTIKTAVSNSLLSYTFPGDSSIASSSFWIPRFSGYVDRTQIFQVILFSLSRAGKSMIFPRQLASGEPVLNEMGQSMNC